MNYLIFQLFELNCRTKLYAFYSCTARCNDEVSRKRKRHAVDPCLGFYLLSSGKIISSPSSKSSHNSSSFGFKALATFTESHENTLVLSSIENKRGTEGICDTSHNQCPKNLPDHGCQHTPKCARPIQPDNPSYEHLNTSSNIASDPGQLMMTVEDFLKRSKKRRDTVKKQYGKPKSRIKRLGDNGDKQYEVSGSDAGDTSQGFMQLRSKKIRRAAVYESSSDESSLLDHEASSPLQIKMRKNRCRTFKPLKERLYEASVLTHGDPDDILIHGTTTGSELASSSRRPLRFVPNAQPELDNSQTDKRRPRTWSLVDPRKSMAIRTASFSSAIQRHLDLTSSARTTNTSLQPPKRWKFANAGLACSSLSNLKPNRQPKMPPVKKTYQYSPLEFVPLKEAEENYKSIFSSDNHKKAGRLDVRTASTLQMVPISETVSRVKGRTSNSTVPTYMHIVPLEKVIQRPSPSVPVAVNQIGILDNLNDMPPASLNSPPIINSVSSPIASALPVIPQSTQDRPITRMNPAYHESSTVNVSERASIRRGLDVTPKPMRPLASFFNEFIKNIRNVAVSQDQLSVADKHLVSRRPLRTASKNGHSLRIPVLLQACTSDLESTRQNDSSHRDHMSIQSLRTPDLSYNQRLSPDILTALEPQNYQVILSSP